MEKLTEKTVEQFNSKGFKAFYFETPEEAVSFVSQEVSDKTVGIGGSMTVREIGLYEALKENNTVYWHWEDKTDGVRQKASSAQVYVSSANGVSSDGCIVNIDGGGNRVSATLFGHEKLFYIFGENKIVPSLDDAVYRAKNIAAPLNARRFGFDLPCVKNEPMKCYDCDCNSPKRICRGIAIAERPMSGIGETYVIIIKGSFGY